MSAKTHIYPHDHMVIIEANQDSPKHEQYGGKKDEAEENRK
jgi:hypothetical protein